MKQCVHVLISLAAFFATVKTHKFKSIEGISLESLKLCTIIDQTGTYIYNASKVSRKIPQSFI